jgi:thiosulfate/3-mercaptopyruvate sulfurtransferase
MPLTTLVDVATLARHLADPDWAVVDCRFLLEDVEWSERAYRAAHIPGAVYAHLDRDLSGEKTGTNGRHPLPDPERLAACLGRFGIDGNTQVVAYDQDNGSRASRLWWLVRWLGHDAVALLDGGFAAWQAESRPTRPDEESRPPRRFREHVREDMVADVAAVTAAAGRDDWRLIDARAPERFRGEVEPIDPVAGHVPGAINRFYTANLDASGRFHTPDELRRQWLETLGGIEASRVICYCGSGVTAAQNLLALEHAGLEGAKLYVGSWSEWSADPARPVARGE